MRFLIWALSPPGYTYHNLNAARGVTRPTIDFNNGDDTERNNVADHIISRRGKEIQSAGDEL